jgi:hypothetical protein
MSPVFWVLVGAGVLVCAAVVWITWRDAQEARALAERHWQAREERRRLASQERFLARLAELRAEAEGEDGCGGGGPAPQPPGLVILGETDAQIADELIRQTAPHRGSRA